MTRVWVGMVPEGKAQWMAAVLTGGEIGRLKLGGFGPDGIRQVAQTERLVGTS